MADEIVFRSNTWLEVKNGYAWFSYGKNSPDTPLRFANPDFQPAPYGLSGILFGSFNGPEGQFYYVCLTRSSSLVVFKCSKICPHP
jgi:hypothetical protein